MQSFKKGQLVTWTSQAGGNTKVKTGKIIEVVEAGKRPGTIPPGWHGWGVGNPRKHKSYVVALVDKAGKPRTAKSYLYWPVVKQLAAAPKEV
jgi:hypothetical protein